MEDFVLGNAEAVSFRGDERAYHILIGVQARPSPRFLDEAQTKALTSATV